jgi:hypothetical protein
MKANQALRKTRVAPVPSIPLPRKDGLLEMQASALAYAPLARAKEAAKPQAIPAIHKDMHPGMYGLATLCWAVFIGIFWLTFAASANALFMVAISTAYALMFFGVPFVMSRLVPRKAKPDSGLFEFLHGKVDTLYGPIDSVEALVQMIVVPVALSLGGIAMGFIIHAERIAY